MTDPYGYARQQQREDPLAELNDAPHHVLHHAGEFPDNCTACRREADAAAPKPSWLSRLLSWLERL